MPTPHKKNTTLMLVISSLVVVVCVGIFSEFDVNQLRSNFLGDGSEAVMCYAPSEVNKKSTEKMTLTSALQLDEEKMKILEQEILTHTGSMNTVQSLIDTLTQEIAVSEREWQEQTMKVTNIEEQKRKKQALETLEKDVQIKESIAQGEKKNLDTLSATVTVKKKDYDTAYAQYHSKRDVDAALARIQLLPNQLIVRQRYDKVALDELKKNLDRMPSDTRVKKIYETNLDLYNKRYIK